MWSIQAVNTARGQRSFWMAISRLTPVPAEACLFNLTNHGLLQPREKVFPASETLSAVFKLQAPCAVPSGAANATDKQRCWSKRRVVLVVWSKRADTVVRVCQYTGHSTCALSQQVGLCHTTCRSTPCLPSQRLQEAGQHALWGCVPFRGTRSSSFGGVAWLVINYCLGSGFNSLEKTQTLYVH